MQEQLWFLGRLDPTSTAYHLPRAVRLKGPLDVAALREAFAALVARHDILRTTFHDDDGQPRQRVLPVGRFALPLHDLGPVSYTHLDVYKRQVLFGHSMGALLAYAMAARQRQAGARLPALLIASGSPAPARRDPHRFDGLDNDAALIDDMRKQGGTPEAVFDSPELQRLALDTLARCV